MNLAEECNKIDLKCILKGLFMVWLGSFLIVEALILQSAYYKDSYEADYVVVLGAGLHGAQLSPTLHYRLDKCLEYLAKHPTAKVVVSGGQGSDEYISEAEAMRKYLVENGVSQSRILLENKSTSTYENVLFSKKVLEEKGTGGREILIITSDFHIFRATLLASRVGLNAYGLPAESVNYLKPYYYFREYFVVIKSFIFDR